MPSKAGAALWVKKDLSTFAIINVCLTPYYFYHNMNKTYKMCCAAAILLLNTLTLAAGNVSIKFAQNVSHASTEAYLVNATTAQEEKLTPASDGYTYTVPSGSNVKLKVTPDKGYVV